MTRHLLSFELKLERAVRLELTYTGFAIRRLSRLATRANWNGRRDSNSRIEFGRLACFRLHHFRERRESRQLAPWLWGEIVDQKMELPAGLEPATSTFEASRSSI